MRPSDVSGLLQFRENPLHAALCNTHGLRHLPHAYPRPPRYAQEHMRVISEESPGGFGFESRVYLRIKASPVDWAAFVLLAPDDPPPRPFALGCVHA